MGADAGGCCSVLLRPEAFIDFLGSKVRDAVCEVNDTMGI